MCQSNRVSQLSNCDSVQLDKSRSLVRSTSIASCSINKLDSDKIVPFLFQILKNMDFQVCFGPKPYFPGFCPKKKVNFQAFQAFPVTLERLFTIYQPITSHQLSTYFGEFMYKFELLIFGFTPEFNRRAQNPHRLKLLWIVSQSNTQ